MQSFDNPNKDIIIIYNKRGILSSRLDGLPGERNSGLLTLYHAILTLNDPGKDAFENIVGKGENAGNQHFLLFPQCFLPFLKQNLIFDSCLICRLQML